MRHQNWPMILEEYIRFHGETDFVWGHNDCVLFSAKGANMLIDRDLTPEMASYGPYDQARALEIVQEKGSFSAIMDAHFPRRDAVNMANRGDIVLVRTEQGKAFGLVDNTGRRVVCKTMNGLLFIPLNKGLRAWEVN